MSRVSKSAKPTGLVSTPVSVSRAFASCAFLDTPADSAFDVSPLLGSSRRNTSKSYHEV